MRGCQLSIWADLAEHPLSISSLMSASPSRRGNNANGLFPLHLAQSQVL
jgi:hypothetical protein